MSLLCGRLGTVLVVLLGAPRALVAQSVPPLVDEVIEAYGGTAAIQALDTHRQEGMLVALNGGGHGEVVRISKGIGSLSVLVAYPSGPEIRIVEQGRGWRGGSPQEMAEVQGPLRLAMVAQAARQYLPRLLADHRERIVLLPPDADSALVLVLPVAQGLELRMFVDPDTRYITRTESVFTEMGGPFGFATDYSDFRDVDGVVFAFREETFASGVHTASLVLSSVELNPPPMRARLPVRN
ncbi:MAG TPA: hypothetical protein VK858_07955 [Longimicrobiales bacterium]|nr:hypothetical protein [Longimicrobiales bacterium]